MASPQIGHDWLSSFPDLERVAPRVPAGLAGLADPVAETKVVLARCGAAEMAHAAASASAPLTVVVNDPHRFTDTPSFLAALFALLDEERSGGTVPVVRVLVAAGTHVSSDGERGDHEARIAGRLRDRIADVVWHDSRDTASHAALAGYDFHAWMAEGGFYLGCGSMEPHYFAGVTGAHKTLTVGVMSRASIEANHAGAMSQAAGGFRLAGNPVHDGVAAALAALEARSERVLALNQLVIDGRVAAVTAGRPLEALEAGLPLVRAAFGHRLREPVDLIVARVGAPLDRDLYQADKGIKNTEAGVRDDGVIILDAGCAHGIGLDHFVELLHAAPTHAAALAVVEKRGYRLGDHKAVRLRALTDRRRVGIALVSPHVDPSMSDVLGMQVFAEPAAAADWAHARLASERIRGLLVEDAGNLSLEIA